ncbi:hypothetical protein [Nocardioides sp.]|uniref:hypothetical protein n=1 Tax=Nocardioides sp. TaxID=35761 RepID=UPI003518FFF1
MTDTTTGPTAGPTTGTAAAPAPETAAAAAERRIVTNRERLAGVVQAVGRRPVDIERRRWESAAVFGAFTVFYAVIGYVLVVRLHVVGFETLDRLNRALMIWHNDPAKLSAVGFDYPPLTVVLLAPFAVVKAGVTSLIVVPLVSALCAGLTMMFLNTMLRRAQVATPVRFLVLAGIGLNPLVVMYAAIGARNFVWLVLVVAALGALFAWYVTADIRFVMIAGLSFATASLTGYGSLLYFLISTVMIAAILTRLGADGTETEGTSVGFASPTVYAVSLWTVLNLVLVGDPFNWITSSSDAPGSGTLDGWSLLDIARATGELLLYGAPIAILVLPALLVVGVTRRNPFALWLGLMLTVSVLAPGAAVLLGVTDSPMAMANSLTILLLATIGGLWLARSADTGATGVAAALGIALVISIPWTYQAMATVPNQGLERVFHDAVRTWEPQDDNLTRSGAAVGIDAEQQMADYITENITARNTILTDNAATYAVMLLTGSPDLFVDRIDASDGPWRQVADAPGGRVSYLLLSIDPADDLLATMYADAAAGTDSVLTTVYANERYRLVTVPADYTYTPDAAIADNATDDPSLEQPSVPTPQEPTDCGGVDGLCGQGPAGTTP